MEHIVDRVLFVLSEDRELQFPAMAVLQAYVNGYADKMARNNPGPPGTYEFELEYSVSGMSAVDWAFFRSAGLHLTAQPKQLPAYDAVFDFSEARADEFVASGKHVVQVFGALCGIGCPPLPVLNKIQPLMPDPDKKRCSIWWQLSPFPLDWEWAKNHCLVGTSRHVMETTLGGTCTGVIDEASWATYYAASCGLPVIELLPAGRPRTWLPKFTSPLYRLVEPELGDVDAQIRSAILDIEEKLCSVVAAAHAKAETQTDQSTSIA